MKQPVWKIILKATSFTSQFKSFKKCHASGLCCQSMKIAFILQLSKRILSVIPQLPAKLSTYMLEMSKCFFTVTVCCIQTNSFDLFSTLEKTRKSLFFLQISACFLNWNRTCFNFSAFFFAKSFERMSSNT